MFELDSVASMASFILILAGVAFLYYMSKLSQYNGASELRATRRIEDVAFYLSKMEEQIDDSEAQLHQKIDSSELDTRIRLTAYETTIGKAVQEKRIRRRAKVMAQ